jgi:hypothetical protein
MGRASVAAVDVGDDTGHPTLLLVVQEAMGDGPHAGLHVGVLPQDDGRRAGCEEKAHGYS